MSIKSLFSRFFCLIGIHIDFLNTGCGKCEKLFDIDEVFWLPISKIFFKPSSRLSKAIATITKADLEEIALPLCFHCAMITKDKYGEPMGFYVLRKYVMGRNKDKNNGEKKCVK